MTRITPDKAEQRIADLDVRLKEANLALADFKSTLKEGRALLADIKKVVDDHCEEVVADAVADSIAKLGVATEAAIETTEQGIFDRFDQLFGVLMGEDKKGKKRRDSETSITELISQLPYCMIHQVKHGPAQVTPICEFLEGRD